MNLTHKYVGSRLFQISLLVLLALVLGAVSHYSPKSTYAPETAHASGSNITGFAWSDNIGWICFDDATYCSTSNVSVDVNGVVSGYAWNDSIGWINFGANSCGAQATLTAGVFTGWAQATSNGGGWDGCISLSGTASDGSTYGPTISGTDFTGYAWGGNDGATPGLVGWISFNCLTGGVGGANICATSNYKVSFGTGAPTCTLTASPNPAATGSSINLGYTTTNSPSTGTIKDPSNATITTAATNSSSTFAATAPNSVGTYNYTMTVSSPAGSGSCSTATTGPLVTKLDICTDIPGLQNPAPGYPCLTPVPAPGTCLQSGVAWDGTQCVVVGPFISNFSAPTRVRNGNPVTLNYTVQNPSTDCEITGTNGYDSGLFTPTNNVQGTVTTNANPITANTQFTITCGSLLRSINVGITPTVIEK